MTNQHSFPEPLRRISDITPDELERYLREARRQRALAFAVALKVVGRLLLRPFRRRRTSVADAGAAAGLATHSR